MTVLVTGAQGFLGAAVCRAYADLEVLALARADADLASEDDVGRLVARLRGRELQAVVHCAATTPFSATSPLDAGAEARMARNLSRLCRELSAGRLVFASGWVVYAPGSPPLSEADDCAPLTPYGAAKLAAEEYFRGHVETVVNARLASIYGPGQTAPGLIPNLVADGLRGGPLTIGAVATRRDYIYIDDAARALRRLVELPLTGHLDVNLGSGASRSVPEVARAVADALAERGPRPEVRVRDVLTEGTPLDNRLDIELGRRLGVLAEPTPLDTGLRRYVGWRADRI